MRTTLLRRALAFLTLASFTSGLAPRTARAEVAREERAAPASEDVGPTQAVAPRSREEARATEERAPAAAQAPRSSSAIDPAAPGATRSRGEAVAPPSLASSSSMSLPGGPEQSGVSKHALSFPAGEGTLEGLGESFSAQLSTGVATLTIPIALPPARGAAGPSLSLSYASSSGHGVAGVGWEIGVPYIARQTDRYAPSYRDPSGGWDPTQDRFVFNGAQELVPICTVGTCANAQPNEGWPAWATGWQYFRPRVEGTFLRFFWSPDHRTWRVQDKNGVSMELGAALDGDPSAGALETDDAGTRIFRWNIARGYDAYGAANPAGGAMPLPVNVVRYRYVVDGGTSYLADIFDTPPATSPVTADVSTYAHHVHLAYETRPDVSTSYRRGWATRQALRLTRIDVSSKPLTGAAAARRLLRRYHLRYDPSWHVSLLTSVQLEGRCGAAGAGEANEPIVEDASGLLPLGTVCPALPPTRLDYAHVVAYDTSGAVLAASQDGYEGFDARVISMTASPPGSVDDRMTDLFDINADGLPDVLTTTPGAFGAGHGVFFNGGSGAPDTFTASQIGIAGVNGDDLATINLANPNVSVGDIDGDGTIDIVHMPMVKTYSVYTPVLQAGAWLWQGRAITTADAQSPKIDLGTDGLDVQRMDVNGDGLVDVVVSSGTELKTFLSLDRYPGGDAQFGHAAWTGAATAAISNDPLTACVPWDGVPVQLGDSTIKIAEMNGDGLPDIVRVQQGNIHYWPGRGNGYWGTGDPSACPSGTFQQGGYVAMGDSPQYADPNGVALHVDDVNGDGLDDLVQIAFDEVDIWLNVDGSDWTARHVIAKTPYSPAYQTRTRIVDMNGSGSRDLLWGDGGHYRYIDLTGGVRPWMLTHVDNGLGKTTDLEYASAASLMLADARAGSAWSSVVPHAMTVLTQTTVSDNLALAGMPVAIRQTQLSYRDPVFDGRQREFRGFRTARERHVGGPTNPTSTVESQFLLGECEDDEPPAGLPSACTFDGRWRDNPREALKGLPLSTQTYDDGGVYSSTEHTTYRLRRLYTGADGREVRHAFPSAKDTYRYDTASGDLAPSAVTLADVEVELAPPPFSASEASASPQIVPAQRSSALVLHGTAGRARLHKSVAVDVFGNTYRSDDAGCIEGCGAGDPSVIELEQPSEVSGSSAWLWKPLTTSVSGTNEPHAWHVHKYTYDTAGSLTSDSSFIQGTLPLARANTGPGGIASPPSSASKDGWITAATVTYDAFGNALTYAGPNGRLRATTFDPDYAALPTQETVYVGAVGPNGHGTTALVRTTVFDRGLAKKLLETDPNGEQTRSTYDGLGQLVSVAAPDPDTGAPSDAASLLVEYRFPADPSSTPYTIVHTSTQDGAKASTASYRESWKYIDGLGRTVVTLEQADTTAGDAAPWIARGFVVVDAKGQSRREYLPFFYSGDPAAFPLAAPVPSPSTSTRYDAFGRGIQVFTLDGAVALSTVYHALSTDRWDAEDAAPGPHQGSFITTRTDGHARTVSTIERVHVNGAIEQHDTQIAYLPIGLPITISRVRVGAADPPVVRWMAYDSAGRLVLNVEPNTGVGAATPGADPSTVTALRYAYDDNGDLVGTSDARGCGVNYAYDAGGRIVGEDYSPCRPEHPAYTKANEVTYAYDAADPSTQGAAAINGFPVDPRRFAGRLASVADRSGVIVSRYDARGRATGTARRMAGPNGGLAPRWYVQSSTLDAANRILGEQTGVVDAGGTLVVTSAVTTAYSKRGAVVSVTSDHGGIVSRVTHDADGLPLDIVYADAAKTTTSLTYDARRRLRSTQTYRSAPPFWASPPASYAPPPSSTSGTLQLLLESLDYTYDDADNPIEIRDSRTPGEWPAGAQPVSRRIQYDDLYRVARFDYEYPSGADTWISPFDAEDRALDPSVKRASPAPRVSLAQRPSWQSYTYDWLGNTAGSADDASAFYDRSLGAAQYGSAGAGPYQLRTASIPSTASARNGALTAAYDPAGNLIGLAATRGGPCLPSGATCSHRFVYDWDEPGHLVRARRWNLASPGAASDPVPTTIPAVDLRYTYDATDDRAVKASFDSSGNAHYTLYPIAALELRGSTWDATAGDYVRSDATQVPYLFSHGVRLARVAYAADGYPTLTSGAAHVLIELGDHLGSTAIVIDRDTSELVEASSYLAFGGADSDYRPIRFNSFREDYRFSGKEEDVEVGLQYFGERYYSPALTRWISADPSWLHSPLHEASTGDYPLNLYEYVSSRALAATDPDGLEPTRWITAPRPQIFVPELPPPEKPRFRIRFQRVFEEFGPPPASPFGSLSPAEIRVHLEAIKPIAFSSETMEGEGAPTGGYVIAIHRRQITPRYSHEAGKLPDGRSAVEAHHGINEAWSAAHVPGATVDNSFSILMQTELHDLSRGVFNQWKMRPDVPKIPNLNPRSRAVQVDWGAVTFEQAKELAELQFDAMKTPRSVRDEYYKRFDEWRELMEGESALRKYEQEKYDWEAAHPPEIRPYEAPPEQ